MTIHSQQPKNFKLILTYKSSILNASVSFKLMLSINSHGQQAFYVSKLVELNSHGQSNSILWTPQPNFLFNIKQGWWSLDFVRDFVGNKPRDRNPHAQQAFVQFPQISERKITDLIWWSTPIGSHEKVDHHMISWMNEAFIANFPFFFFSLSPKTWLPKKPKE